MKKLCCSVLLLLAAASAALAAEWRTAVPPRDGVTVARFELWRADKATTDSTPIPVILLVSDYEGGKSLYDDPAWRAWATESGAAIVRHRVERDVVRFKLVRGEPLAAAIEEGLAALAATAGSSSLATAPWIATGLSQSGLQAQSLAVARPARTAAVIAWHASTGVHAPELYFAPEAATIPMLHLMAGEERFPINVAPFVLAVRARGAPWAYALQVGVPHQRLGAPALPLAWLRGTLARRLPATTGKPLRGIELAGGWLSRAVEYEPRPGDRRVAEAGVLPWDDAPERAAGGRDQLPWWPDEASARAWLAATPVTPPPAVAAP